MAILLAGEIALLVLALALIAGMCAYLWDEHPSRAISIAPYNAP
jgi:hypothetical protein